jgi:hypothetical protein
MKKEIIIIVAFLLTLGCIEQKANSSNCDCNCQNTHAENQIKKEFIWSVTGEELQENKVADYNRQCLSLCSDSGYQNGYVAIDDYLVMNECVCQSEIDSLNIPLFEEA